MPKLRTEKFGGGDQRWLLTSHGLTNGLTGTLDVESFTKNTHYPDGYFPSGTPLDVVDPGSIKPYVAGTTQKLGFLLFDSAVVDGLAAPVSYIPHGYINPDFVPGKPTFDEDSYPSFVFVKGGGGS